MTFSEAIKMGLREDLIEAKEDIDSLIKMLDKIDEFNRKANSLNLTDEQKRLFADMFESEQDGI